MAWKPRANPPGGTVARMRTRLLLSAHRDFWCPSAGTLVSAYREYELSVVRRNRDPACYIGARVQRVGGCCGLAGNFGVEKGHYETSVAIAEHDLLPAVRDAGPDAVVLADGFSCRTQLDDLAGRPALHLAELLLGRHTSRS